MEPVIVTLHTGKAMFLAVLFGACALLFGGPALTIALTLWRFDSEIAMALGLTAVFLGLSVYNLGTALRRPVVLRMDEKGISGF